MVRARVLRDSNVGAKERGADFRDQLFGSVRGITEALAEFAIKAMLLDIAGRDLYRAQKSESRRVERQATHSFERAVFVFINRERLGHGKPLTFREMVRLIRNQGRLLDRLDSVHEKERRFLAQAEKAEKPFWSSQSSPATRASSPNCARSTRPSVRSSVTLSLQNHGASASSRRRHRCALIPVCKILPEGRSSAIKM